MTFGTLAWNTAALTPTTAVVKHLQKSYAENLLSPLVKRTFWLVGKGLYIPERNEQFGPQLHSVNSWRKECFGVMFA